MRFIGSFYLTIFNLHTSRSVQVVVLKDQSILCMPFSNNGYDNMLY